MADGQNGTDTLHSIERIVGTDESDVIILQSSGDFSAIDWIDLGLSGTLTDPNGNRYVDTVNVSRLSAGVTINLVDPSNQTLVVKGSSSVLHFRNVDAVDGTNHDDVLIAGAPSGDMIGFALNGGVGRDTITGGLGDDALFGIDGIRGVDDKSADLLTGGAGSDRFKVGDGDVITDIGVGDNVWLGDVELRGGTQIKLNSPIYQGNGFTYQLSGTTLTVTGATGTIIIKDYNKVAQEGGITLRDKDPNDPPSDPPTPPNDDPVPPPPDNPAPGDPGGPWPGGGPPPGTPGYPEPTGRTPPEGLPDSPPTYRDPIILSLSGGALELVSLDASDAFFDFTDSGYRQHTGWVTSNMGLLVELPADGATVTSAELLGAISGDGFADLAGMDTNQDGLVTSLDMGWASLRVWVDSNGDGASTATELHDLVSLAIESFGLDFVDAPQTVAGNSVVATGSFFIGGENRQMTEVNFATNRQSTAPTPDRNVVYTEDAWKLPVLPGYGAMLDLRAAVSLDGDLANAVKDLVVNSSTMTGAQFDAAFENMLHMWAGVDDVAPGSSGPHIDARHHQFVYAYYGIDPVADPYYAEQPNWHNGPTVWEPRYQAIVDSLKTRFVSQIGSSLAAYGADAGYLATNPYIAFELLNYDGATDRFLGDVESVMDLLTELIPADPIAEQTFWGQTGPILAGLRLETDSVGASWHMLTEAFADGFDTDGINAIGTALGYSMKLGTSGADVYTGGGTSDFFMGDSGDDRMDAYAGDDILIGGAGNDVLQGGSGSDSYVFNLGDGQDRIFEAESQFTIGGSERLIFGLGITLDDLILTKPMSDWNDLKIEIDGTADSILIDNQDDSYQNRYYNRIEQFVFQTLEPDGTISETVVSQADIQALRIAQASTSDADEIVGSTASDLIDGDAGNDTLYGWTGNDTLVGGLGNDVVQGGAGNDTYVFNLGDGQDRIFEAESQFTSGGTERLVFGLGITLDDLILTKPMSDWNDLKIEIAGTTDSILIDNQDDSYQNRYYNRIEQFVFQTLQPDGSITETSVSEAELQALRIARAKTTQDDTIVGSTGSDTIEGDAGVDTLYGWTGNDTLVGGTGNDVLQGRAGDDVYRFNRGDGQDRIYEAESRFTTGGNERLVFGLGIQLSDLIVTRPSTDINDLRIQISGTNDIILIDNHYITYQGRAYNRIEQFVFQTLQPDGSITESVVTSTQMEAYRIARAITDGNDTINGSSGGDELPGAGGHDAIYGLAGNDTITGGTGNDSVQGGAGNDTYRFNIGDGQDVIFEAESRYTSGGSERLVFGPGITVDDLILIKPGSDWDDLLIQIAGTNDSVLINQQDDNYQNRYYNRIETFVFQTLNEDESITETSLSHAQLQAIRLARAKTVNNDTIIGSTGSDLMEGDAGNDVLYGWTGNDTFVGGTGNDVLRGSAGNDIYRFNLGDGQDYIFEDESQFENGGAEQLIFGLGITLDDLLLSKPGDWNDLVIQIAGTNDSILIDNQDDSYQNRYYNRIEQFVFQTLQPNGSITQTIVGEAALQAIRIARAKTVNNDTIVGSTGSDLIEGDAGNDLLYGWTGNDTLVGGTGNDVLEGRAGSDTYSFNLGDGQDRIYEAESQFDQGGTERLVFGLGIELADLVVTKPSDVNDLLIQISGTSDSILIDNNDISYQGRFYNRVEQFGFQTLQPDGSTTQVTVLSRTGTTAADAITGSASSDFVMGFAGNDTLAGLGADDRIDGGDGNDRMTGGAGNDLIGGGAGTDIAVFAGDFASYEISTIGGTIQIRDLDAVTDGDDGTDTLSVVETAEFKGGFQHSLAAPIILDIDGDGVEMVEKGRSGTRFDWNGDGKADRTGWVGEGDGLLVYDRDRNGTVSGADELSFTDDKPGAKSDLDGLSAFDSNQDGLFSADDAAWSDFRVWMDGNANGRVDDGEFLTMAQAGVASIDLIGTPTEQSWDWGQNIVINDGIFTRTDGTSGGFADAALSYMAGDANALGRYALSGGELADALADFRGSRQISDYLMGLLQDRLPDHFAAHLPQLGDWDLMT